MIQIALATGFILILMGLYGALTNRDIIRMIIGFTVADTGVNVVLVAVGVLPGRTAPILDIDLARRCRPEDHRPGAAGPRAHGHRHRPRRSPR